MKYTINSGYYFSSTNENATMRCVSVESTDMIIYEFDDEVAMTLIKTLQSGPASLDQLYHQIEEEFEVEDLDYQQDVQEFLAELVEKGILDQHS